jgi:hypothetical protein
MVKHHNTLNESPDEAQDELVIRPVKFPDRLQLSAVRNLLLLRPSENQNSLQYTLRILLMVIVIRGEVQDIIAHPFG